MAADAPPRFGALSLVGWLVFSLSACSSSSTNPAVGGAGGAGAGGGSGGSAGTGAAGASGGSGPCGVGALCVQPPPLGWTGPTAVWHGAADAVPPCASPLTEAQTAYANATWPSPKCSACSCAPATNGNCTASVWLGASSCATPVLNGVGTSCATSSISGSTTFTQGKFSTSLSGGSCTPGQATPLPAAPTVGEGMRACSGIELPAATCSGQCVYAPPAPFDAVCVFKAGDEPCPLGEYSKKAVYQSWDDQRSCTPCSCGAPSGGACSAHLAIYSGGACGVPTAVLSSANACTPLGQSISAPNSVSAAISQVTVTQPAACAASGGEGQGQLVVTGQLTVCCRP